MNELYHHGIKGQKWGVRRFQNKNGSLTPAGQKRYGSTRPDSKINSKEYHAEYEKRRDKYAEADPEYSKAKKYRDEAYKLLDEYDFDADDGGGGRTEADRKAGAKYMELMEKYDDLATEIRARACEKATKDMIEKYGEKKVKYMERKDNVKGAAAAAALLSVYASAPLLVSMPTAAFYAVLFATAATKKADKADQN